MCVKFKFAVASWSVSSEPPAALPPDACRLPPCRTHTSLLHMYKCLTATVGVCLPLLAKSPSLSPHSSFCPPSTSLAASPAPKMVSFWPWKVPRIPISPATNSFSQVNPNSALHRATRPRRRPSKRPCPSCRPESQTPKLASIACAPTPAESKSYGPSTLVLRT